MATFIEHAQAASIWNARESNEAGRAALAAWINEVQGNERRGRKDAAFIYLYGACREPLARALDRI